MVEPPANAQERSERLDLLNIFVKRRAVLYDEFKASQKARRAARETERRATVELHRTEEAAALARYRADCARLDDEQAHAIDELAAAQDEAKQARRDAELDAIRDLVVQAATTEPGLIGTQLIDRVYTLRQGLTAPVVKEAIFRAVDSGRLAQHDSVDGAITYWLTGAAPVKPKTRRKRA